MKSRSLFGLTLSFMLTMMCGCGGGGGGGGGGAVGGGSGGGVQSMQTATVKVRSQGTLPAGSTAIGAITAFLNYSTTKGLSIAPANVAASGAGAGSVVALNTNTGTPGQVGIGLTNATGIQTGEFATLTFSFPAGTGVTAAHFSIAATPAATVLNTALGNPVLVSPPIFINVSSVTIQ